MNYPNYNKHFYIKHQYSNDNSKNNISINDINKNSYSNDSKQNYNNEFCFFKKTNKANCAYFPKNFFNEIDRSSLKDPYNYNDKQFTEETLNKERRNYQDNIINSSNIEMEFVPSHKSEVDQKFSSKGNYSDLIKGAKFGKNQNDNLRPMNYDSNYPTHNEYRNLSNDIPSQFYNTQPSYQNNSDLLEIINSRKQNQNLSKSLFGHCNINFPQNEIHNGLMHNILGHRDKISQILLSTNENTGESPISSADKQFDMRINSTILTTLVSKRTNEMKKISSKILKETLTDYTIEKDKKSFSFLFSEVSLLEEKEPFKFTNYSQFLTEESRVLTPEHFIKQKKIRNLKSEIFHLSKKLASERIYISSHKEKISKNHFNKKIMKIKQFELQTNIDKIFSDY